MTKPSRFDPVILATLAFAACAGPRGAGPGAGGPAYPPRPATCELTFYHAPTPIGVAWHDLGVAEVICHIDVGFRACLQGFRAEACRMGGDIVYGLPQEPLRPREQAVMYRGRVAHTRVAPPGP